MAALAIPLWGTAGTCDCLNSCAYSALMACTIIPLSSYTVHERETFIESHFSQLCILIWWQYFFFWFYQIIICAFNLEHWRFGSGSKVSSGISASPQRFSVLGPWQNEFITLSACVFFENSVAFGLLWMPPLPLALIKHSSRSWQRRWLRKESTSETNQFNGLPIRNEIVHHNDTAILFDRTKPLTDHSVFQH